MIISLRGTSGSGKSHMVRTVVSQYERHRDVYTEGRKKPLYTIHGRSPSGRCLVVPGHYEIKNGGVDTLPDLETAYDIAHWATRSGHDVLMEGKNMSDGVARVNQLVEKKFRVHVVRIDIPLRACVHSVRKRGHNISEDSIRRTRNKVERDAANFKCPVFSGNRAECLAKILELLGMESAK